MKIVQVKDKDAELKRSQGTREGRRYAVVCWSQLIPAHESRLLEFNSIIKHCLYYRLNYINLQFKLLLLKQR